MSQDKAAETETGRRGQPLVGCTGPTGGRQLRQLILRDWASRRWSSGKRGPEKKGGGPRLAASQGRVWLGRSSPSPHDPLESCCRLLASPEREGLP